MRNMKTITTTNGCCCFNNTVTASLVVACGTQAKVPALNGKYATLLRWYSNENTSLINQELKNDDTTGKEKYSIEADYKKIMMTNFKNSLLKANETRNPNQAKVAVAATFLKERIRNYKW